MLRIKNVNHVYSSKAIRYQALFDINIEIPDSKFIVIIGQSGSGKTTLLNIIAGLMKPSQGNVYFNDVDIYSLNDKMLCDFRRDNIGFIFQNFFLENAFTASENVSIPLLNKRLKIDEVKAKSSHYLSLVGLKGKENNKPFELSGGEAQRVSIARALANDPSIIIADEPTGNLDSLNGEMVINILKEEVKKGKTVIMVTHNNEYIKYADILINIKDGRVL